MSTPNPDPNRSAFEEWISAKPYEREVDRFPTRIHKWAGQYQDYAVELAWGCWQLAGTSKDLAGELARYFGTDGEFKPKMLDHKRVQELLDRARKPTNAQSQAVSALP